MVNFSLWNKIQNGTRQKIFPFVIDVCLNDRVIFFVSFFSIVLADHPCSTRVPLLSLSFWSHWERCHRFICSYAVQNYIGTLECQCVSLLVLVQRFTPSPLSSCPLCYVQESSIKWINNYRITFILNSAAESCSYVCSATWHLQLPTLAYGITSLPWFGHLSKENSSILTTGHFIGQSS